MNTARKNSRKTRGIRCSHSTSGRSSNVTGVQASLSGSGWRSRSSSRTTETSLGASVPILTWLPFTSRTVTTMSSEMRRDSPTRRVRINMIALLALLSCGLSPRPIESYQSDPIQVKPRACRAVSMPCWSSASAALPSRPEMVLSVVSRSDTGGCLSTRIASAIFGRPARILGQCSRPERIPPYSE